MLISDDEIGSKIYDVLVKDCGAPEGQRAEFIYHFCNIASLHAGDLEYRFQGWLGWGGKVLIRTQRLHSPPAINVTCYLEDRNHEREKMITKAVTKIREILKDIN